MILHSSAFSRFRNWVGESVIENNQVGGGGCDQPAEFFQLAAADQRGRVGRLARLQRRVDHLRAGAPGQFLQLLQRLPRGDIGSSRDSADCLELQADQDGFLAPLGRPVVALGFQVLGANCSALTHFSGRGRRR